MTPEQLAARWLADCASDAREVYADTCKTGAVELIPSYTMEETAARIAAQEATIKGLEAERNAAITIAETAIAEADTLRDHLARMEGALTLIAELTENRSIKRLARAALTDGGSNG